MKKLMATLIVALTLTGCAATLPPPVYVDAFHGLLNRTSAAVPVDQPATVAQPLGLIFSENLEQYLKYIKAADVGLKSYGAFTNTNAVVDIDPKFIAGRVLIMLRAHYPSIVLVDDFNHAVSSGKKGVLLIDIQPVLGSLSGQTTTVTITAYVFNERMQPVSRISGQGSSVVPYPAWDVGLQPSIDGAIRQLDAKLTTHVR